MTSKIRDKMPDRMDEKDRNTDSLEQRVLSASDSVMRKDIEPSDLPSDSGVQDSVDADDGPPPKGGFRAWLVVLGAFICVMVSFGWLNCIGVFQQYYETHQLRDYSSSEVSWITSVESFLLLFGTVFFGLAFDTHGPRPLLIIGTLLHFAGLLAASFSTEYYQFLLSQGICSAIGCSSLMACASASVGTWFSPDKYQGVALGIVVSGSSIGGIILPIMIRNLLPQVGFGWTMRSVAFLFLGLLCLAIPLVQVRGKRTKRLPKLKEFVLPWKERVFMLTALGAFFYGFALFPPLNFIVAEMTYYGVDESLAVNTVSMLNGANFFGRILPPFLANRIGRFNTMMIIAFMTAITLLCIWLPARHSTPGPIVFAIFYGFFSGAFTALSPACIVQISKPEEYGVRIGSMFAISGIGALVGSPIGGELLTANGGGYEGLMGFVGGMAVCSFGLYGLARYSQAKLRINKI